MRVCVRVIFIFIANHMEIVRFLMIRSTMEYIIWTYWQHLKQTLLHICNSFNTQDTIAQITDNLILSVNNRNFARESQIYL